MPQQPVCVFAKCAAEMAAVALGDGCVRAFAAIGGQPNGSGMKKTNPDRGFRGEGKGQPYSVCERTYIAM